MISFHPFKMKEFCTVLTWCQMSAVWTLQGGCKNVYRNGGIRYPMGPWQESSLKWRHNERVSASNDQPHHCWFNRIFMRRSKKTSKLRITDLCEGNSSVTGEFPAQKGSNTENASIWLRHHALYHRCKHIPACKNVSQNIQYPSKYSDRSYDSLINIGVTKS